MKRSEYRTFLKLLHHLVCYELAADEFFRTMHDPVTHSLDILKILKNSDLFVEKSIKHCLDTDCMIFDRHLLLKLLLAVSLMFETSCLHSDPFYDSFCKKVIDLFTLHVKKLILQ